MNPGTKGRFGFSQGGFSPLFNLLTKSILTCTLTHPCRGPTPYLQDTYRELVGFLMESQSEAANRERLSEAFAELTRNTPFTADRINRIRDDRERNVSRTNDCSWRYR